MNEYKSSLGMHKTQCINFKHEFSFPSSPGLTGKMANSSRNDSESLRLKCVKRPHLLYCIMHNNWKYF